MTRHYYHFTIHMTGEGKDAEEAWADACDNALENFSEFARGGDDLPEWELLGEADEDDDDEDDPNPEPEEAP
jgi:hypothetical protein